MFYGVAIFGRGVMVTNSWESVTSAYADVSAVNSCPKQKSEVPVLASRNIYLKKKKVIIKLLKCKDTFCKCYSLTTFIGFCDFQLYNYCLSLKSNLLCVVKYFSVI